MEMKTVKNVITRDKGGSWGVISRGFLVIVLTLVAMAAVCMPGDGAGTGAKIVQAKAKNAPKGANKKDVSELKKLINFQNKHNAGIEEDMSHVNYTWEDGRLVQMVLFAQATSESGGRTIGGGKGKLDFSGFTSLKTLYIQYFGGVTEVDVSKNKKLKELNCYGCPKIKNFKMSEKNKRLNRLDLNCLKKVKKIDVSKLSGLKIFYVDNFAFTSLDLSKNKNLEYFIVTDTANGKTGLKKLSLPRSKKLKEITTHYTELSSLDLSYYTNLNKLACVGNRKLKTIKLPKNLKSLDCSANSLTGCLDLSKCVKLEGIACAENQLTTLKLPKTSTLKSVDCSKNRLTSLDVSGLSSLTFLRYAENQITDVDTSGCPNLQN